MCLSFFGSFLLLSPLISSLTVQHRTSHALPWWPSYIERKIVVLSSYHLPKFSTSTVSLLNGYLFWTGQQRPVCNLSTSDFKNHHHKSSSSCQLWLNKKGCTLRLKKCQHMTLLVCSGPDSFFLWAKHWFWLFIMLEDENGNARYLELHSKFHWSWPLLVLLNGS